MPEWIEDEPTSKWIEDKPESNSWIETGIRTVPAVAGSILGGIAGIPAFGVGAVGGGMAGGAAGAALGNVLGDWYSGKEFNPKEFAVTTALGGLPPILGPAKYAGTGLGAIAKYAGKTALLNALEGGVVNAASTPFQHWAEAGDFNATPEEYLRNAGTGAAFGGALGGAFGAYHGRGLSKVGNARPVTASEIPITRPTPRVSPDPNLPPNWLPFEHVPQDRPDVPPMGDSPLRQDNLPFEEPYEGDLPFGAYRSPKGRYTKSGPGMPSTARPFIEEPLQQAFDLDSIERTTPPSPSPVSPTPTPDTSTSINVDITSPNVIPSGSSLSPDGQTVTITSPSKKLLEYWRSQGFKTAPDQRSPEGYPQLVRDKDALPNDIGSLSVSKDRINDKLIKDMKDNGYELSEESSTHGIFRRLMSDEEGTFDPQQMWENLKRLLGRDPTPEEVEQGMDRQVRPGESTGRVAQFGRPSAERSQLIPHEPTQEELNISRAGRDTEDLADIQNGIDPNQYPTGPIPTENDIAGIRPQEVLGPRALSPEDVSVPMQEGQQELPWSRGVADQPIDADAYAREMQSAANVFKRPQDVVPEQLSMEGPMKDAEINDYLNQDIGGQPPKRRTWSDEFKRFIDDESGMFDPQAAWENLKRKLGRNPTDQEVMEEVTRQADEPEPSVPSPPRFSDEDGTFERATAYLDQVTDLDELQGMLDDVSAGFAYHQKSGDNMELHYYRQLLDRVDKRIQKVASEENVRPNVQRIIDALHKEARAMGINPTDYRSLSELEDALTRAHEAQFKVGGDIYGEEGARYEAEDTGIRESSLIKSDPIATAYVETIQNMGKQRTFELNHKVVEAQHLILKSMQRDLTKKEIQRFHELAEFIRSDPNVSKTDKENFEYDTYQLPDGNTIKVDATASKGLPEIDFTTKEGKSIKIQRLMREFLTDEQGATPITDITSMLKRMKEFAGNKDDEHAILKEILAVPRNATTTLDLSAPGRQGLPLIGTPEFWKAAGQMFRGLSPRAFDQIDADLRNKKIMRRPVDPNTGKEGKSFADLIGTRMFSPASQPGPRAEATASRWLEMGIGEGVGSKIWRNTAGIPIRASNRAYITFLNSLNVNRTEKLLDLARDMSIEALTTGSARPGIMRQNFTPEQAIDLNPYHNLVRAKEIAEFVNAATGHATAKGGLSLENAVSKIGPFLFSPGLLNSRIRMMNPATYIMASPYVRKQYAKAALSTAAAWFVATELIKKSAGPDAEVSNDITNADFGKVRIGDARLDLGGGFLQFATAYGRMYQGGSTSSASGEFHRFGSGYQAQTQENMMQRFFVNKLDPATKFAYDVLNATEYNPFHVADRTAQLFTPLFIQDLKEIYKENPSLLPLFAPIALFGGGSQIYSKGESISKFVDPEQDWNVTGGGLRDLMPWNMNVDPGERHTFPWSDETY